MRGGGEFHVFAAGGDVGAAGDGDFAGLGFFDADGAFGLQASGEGLGEQRGHVLDDEEGRAGE